MIIIYSHNHFLIAVSCEASNQRLNLLPWRNHSIQSYLPTLMAQLAPIQKPFHTKLFTHPYEWTSVSPKMVYRAVTDISWSSWFHSFALIFGKVENHSSVSMLGKSHESKDSVYAFNDRYMPTLSKARRITH